MSADPGSACWNLLAEVSTEYESQAGIHINILINNQQ